MSEPVRVVSDPWLPVRWPEYVEPASAVLALVQMLLTSITGERLVQAYMRDWRASSAALEGSEPKS